MGFPWGYFTPISGVTVDGRNPATPGMVLNPCKYWEKLYTLSSGAGILPSTVWDPTYNWFLGPPCRDPDSLAQEVEKNSDSQEVARLKKVWCLHGVCCRYFVFCFDGLFLSSLRQYPTLKLLGSTYLVGKVKIYPP